MLDHLALHVEGQKLWLINWMRCSSKIKELHGNCPESHVVRLFHSHTPWDFLTFAITVHSDLRMNWWRWSVVQGQKHFLMLEKHNSGREFLLLSYWIDDTNLGCWQPWNCADCIDLMGSWFEYMLEASPFPKKKKKIELLCCNINIWSIVLHQAPKFCWF